jgi:hypothetical protein
MILGDLGANILKVEPIDGDMTRGYPPFGPEGSSTYFLGAKVAPGLPCALYAATAPSFRAGHLWTS